MTTTVLQRLLQYPHQAVFDTSPAPELALRLRNPTGLVWSVENKVLRLVVGQSLTWDGTTDFSGVFDWGITRREYDLAGKTIAQLANELRADGHEIAYQNSSVGALSAAALISGAGDQTESNGDHLEVFTSLLWVLFTGYADELIEAGSQIQEALRQMVIPQAEGMWLDVWATLYGVPRLPGETDEELRARIPQEVFRLRVNGLALEQAVRDLAGDEVVIDEPWKRMFALDVSALSGPDHMQDGRFYTYHVIQPVGQEGTNWSRVYHILERNKAAGIEIYAPRVDFPPRQVDLADAVEYRIHRGTAEYRGSGIFGTNNQILGVMRLSSNEITLNHPVARHDWWQVWQEPEIQFNGIHGYDGEATYSSPLDTQHFGLQLHQQIWPARNIAMAAITLSDGAELGDENAILSRGVESFEFVPEPILSEEMFLSGYDAVRTVERVEVVTTQANVAGVENAVPPEVEDVGQVDTRAYASNEAFPLRVAGLTITNTSA